MYGSGCSRPTASGVRSREARPKRSSALELALFVQSSTWPTTIPASSRAAARSRFQSFAWRAVSSSTCSRISAASGAACGRLETCDGDSGFDLVEQARHPDHEELVEVPGEERADARTPSRRQDGSDASASTRAFHDSHEAPD
jgi:hypothetical protein